jgi:hypothetical protein
VPVDVLVFAVDGDRAARGEDSEVICGDDIAADGDCQRAGVAEENARGQRVAFGGAEVVDADPVPDDSIAGEFSPGA